MPYSTYVPSDELERPQRDALQRALEAMTPPGLVQQGTMLQERFRALGPVQAAERTAGDLAGLFGRLGAVGQHLPGGAGWNADLDRIRREREAAEAQFPTPPPSGPAGFTLPETGTAEGERITGALAETALRELPGMQSQVAALRSLSPEPMTADSPLGNVAGIAGLGAQTVLGPASMALQAGTGAAMGALPGGEDVPRWAKDRGLTKDTPVLGGLLTPDVGIPAAVGLATGGVDDLLSGARRVPGVVDDLTGLARRLPSRFSQAAAEETPDAALGIRRGQRFRMPALTPEEQAQRARDGAAEQRVFDAIARLWRAGPEGAAAADDLRFLAVGKGEAGEAAAREYLAGAGLDDLLPSPGVVAPAASAGDGLLSQGPLGLARRATEPLGARAARTGGERAFDVAAGTAGGVAGAATAEEDATWQERVGRGVVGASLGALGGAHLRQLGRVGGRALGDEAPGLLPGRAPAEGWQHPPGTAPARRPAVPAAPESDLARASRQAREARLGTPPEEAGPPLEAAPGVSGWGRAADIATAAPLLRPSSLLTNLLGGAVRTFQRWGEESTGALLTEGALKESLADLLGMASEVPGALRALPRTFRQGGTSAVRGQLGAQGESLVTDPGVGAQLLTAGTRLNLAPDAAWGRINAAGAKARAAARGITDPDDVAELSGRAMDFAQWAGKASKLTEFLGGFRETLTDPNASAAHKAWALGMVGVTPYLRMPERFLAATGRLVLDPAVLGASRFTKNGLVRQAMEGNQEAKREVAGRLAMSGLAYTLGLGAYAGGQLYGAPPEDAKQRRQMEAAGARWNTLMGVDLKKLGNFGQAMSGMGTALYAAQRKYEEGADGSDVMRAFFSEAGRWALEESFLRGLSDFDVAIRQGRGFQQLEKTAADIATRPLSGIAGYVDPFDPYERERRGTTNELLEGLPGGRFALPTRVDPATGEAVRRGGNWLERMLFGSQGRVESPEGRELARLGVTAREFQPADTVYGNVQTPQARRVLQETFGRTTRDYVRDTMARPDYKGATEEEQAATLRRQVGLAQKLADLEVGDRVARDPQARFELEWLRTPHYQGVTGAPDQVARRNLEISEAKQLLSEYRQRYGTGAGTDRLYRENRAVLELAMTPEIPAAYLAEQQAKLRQRTGAPDTRSAALPGAGNRVLPPNATPSFTAP